MRFVIVLALLCCCYATEQNTSAAQQEGHPAPQHIKDFVEQHIKYVKKQIPLVQQQIKEGKVKVKIVKPNIDDQQVPENIKNFIKSHISKILEYVAQQKQKKQLDASATIGVPPFVVQKIEILMEKVKNIRKKVETHIPQAINQQIAFKNQIKYKQENSDKEIPIVANNVQGIVPQVVHQHADVVKKDDQNDKQILKRDVKEKPIVPDNVQGIVDYKPHVINQHVATIDKKIGQEKHVSPGPIQGTAEQSHQHVSHVTDQNVNQIQMEADKENSVVPGRIQEIVEHTHQHVSQHVAQADKKTNQNIPVVPQYIQGIVEKIHHHVPQVIKQRINQVQIKNDNGNSLVPGQIQGVALQIHQHVSEKKDVQESSASLVNVQDIAQEVNQHVPQMENQNVAQAEKKGVQVSPIVPSNIEGVVQQSHLHIPQVINHSKDHITQEHTNFVKPNQPIAHTVNSHVAATDIQSNALHVYGNVHPVVQIVDKLTQHKVVKNDNIVPSRVQQVKNDYHISPVRTT